MIDTGLSMEYPVAVLIGTTLFAIFIVVVLRLVTGSWEWLLQ
jgi:hypothetical protein